MELLKKYITPIQKMNENLNNNSFYVKRDDLFPFSFGGNKARKSLFFFEDIKKNNNNYIVTYGSSSSNHCRIVANMAASIGIPCHIISPSDNSMSTYNSDMMTILGATVSICPLTEVSNSIDMKMQELRDNGLNPYFIEGGGHGNKGTEAYVKVFEEIVQFEITNNINFDIIFLTSGTGTTQAGLVCGNYIMGHNKQIIGISNARKNPYGREVIHKSVNEYLTSINSGLLDLEDIIFIDDYVLDGYGSYNKEVLLTIKEVLIKEGIPLDTTYTGKAYWGMKEYIKKNMIKNKNILFIHTGGTPLFFDKLEDLKYV